MFNSTVWELDRVNQFEAFKSKSRDGGKNKHVFALILQRKFSNFCADEVRSAHASASMPSSFRLCLFVCLFEFGTVS